MLWARICLLAVLCSAVFAAQTPESPLVITNAGVQRSEDAPFISPSYRFLPGEFVHFTFQVAGFKATTATEKQARKIGLTYTVTAEDGRGVPLAPPSADAVNVELNPEDKDWSPKRRVFFHLPSFIAAGTYHVHIEIKDIIANTETARDFSFKIGGAVVVPTDSVAIQSFQFFRGENDREPVEVAAYQPGDPIYTRFRITGFKKEGEDNHYSISYSVTVLRPDGKPFLRDAPDAVLESKSFYPAPYVPGEFGLTTSKDTAKGQYRINVTVRDRIAGTQSDFQTSFSIE